MISKKGLLNLACAFAVFVCASACGKKKTTDDSTSSSLPSTISTSATN